MNKPVKIFVCAALVILGCNDTPDKLTGVGSNPEITITRVKLSDLANDPIDMTGYKGKTVFINFWATWCKPCLEEMPSIKKAMDMLKEEKIEFLFASVETSEQVESFKAENDYGFNFVNAGNLEELNVVGLPTTFIFNAEGQLAFSEMGKRNWDEKENIDLIRNIIRSK